MTSATNTPEPEINRQRAYRTARLDAFSDGVFAIAITLLILEIAVPEGSEDDLLAAVAAQWPSYLAYVVSFASVGVAWLLHNGVTEYLRFADPTFVRLNLLLLLVITFIPFPTRLLGEAIGSENAERVAVTIYGLTLLASSAVLSTMWRYARRAGLLRDDAPAEDVAELNRRLTPGLAGYAVVVLVGLFLPFVAVLGYLAIAIVLLVPVPARRKAV